MGNAILLFLASLLGVLPNGDAPRGPMLQRAAEPSADAPPTWPLTFFFENRAEALAIELFDGRIPTVASDALAQLSHHVRCFRTDKEKAIHPRLAEIVARAAEAFGRENVRVVSGYRARPYGAPHSKHFLGRAM